MGSLGTLELASVRKRSTSAVWIGAKDASYSPGQLYATISLSSSLATYSIYSITSYGANYSSFFIAVYAQN